jgi:glycosyltransferase involved in cell wall biosynthesis
MSELGWPQRVLLLYEGSNFGGELDMSFVDGLKAHGCDVTCVERGQPWSPPFDLVLGYGPFSLEEGSILPVAQQLLDIPIGERPIFAWWLTEGVPDPRYPDWLINGASRLRIKADEIIANDPSSTPSYWRNLALKGHRLRIYGQLKLVKAQGLLDVLAVTSKTRASYLQQRGLDPIVAPLGYHPTYGEDINIDRDIDVAFLGNISAPRRQHLLPKIFNELEESGIKVRVETFLYGDERTELLNRSRILLNVLRAPQDFVGQRFLLASANKCLVISEPLLDHEPFVPGQHLVMAPLEKIPDTVQYYLANENKRREIADRAYQFVTSELTTANSVGRILAKARQVRVAKEEKTWQSVS